MHGSLQKLLLPDFPRFSINISTHTLNHVTKYKKEAIIE